LGKSPHCLAATAVADQEQQTDKSGCSHPWSHDHAQSPAERLGDQPRPSLCASARMALLLIQASSLCAQRDRMVVPTTNRPHRGKEETW